MPKAEDLFCILFYYFTMTFGFVNFTSWVNFRKGLPIFLLGIGKSCTGFFNFSLHLLRSCFLPVFHFYGLYLTTWITLRHNRCLTCLYVCPLCCRWNTQLLSWGFGSVLFSLSISSYRISLLCLHSQVFGFIINHFFRFLSSASLCMCECVFYVCMRVSVFKYYFPFCYFWFSTSTTHNLFV